jgi:hypothetical protein
MIKVKIGAEEKDLSSADEQWINQQINMRRGEGQSVCVRVTIQEGGVDIVLATPTCGAGGGGGRRLESQEQKVVDLWIHRGLNDASFTGGNLIAFLKQIGI